MDMHVPALTRLSIALAVTLGAVALCASSALGASSAPTVSTAGSSNVTDSSAILYGDVNADGLTTDYYFQYGTTSGYGTQTSPLPAGNGTISLKFSAAISGLQPDTTYHYRIVAADSAGTTVGKDHTFTTASVPLSVQIAAVPDPVVFGSPFVVEGRLSGTGAADHQVALQMEPFPYRAGFKDVGNAELTNSAGGFSFPYVGLLESARLRVLTVGKPEVVSPVLVEDVAVRVSLHVRPARRRGYVYMYGSVAPAEVGALVGFQLIRGNRSINVGGTVVKVAGPSVSRFGRVVRLRHRGVYRALVEVPDGGHVSGLSEPILVR